SASTGAADRYGPIYPKHALRERDGAGRSDVNRVAAGGVINGVSQRCRCPVVRDRGNCPCRSHARQITAKGQQSHGKKECQTGKAHRIPPGAEERRRKKAANFTSST